MSDEILEEALKALTKEFDEFITSCLDKSGKPQAPKIGALMKARGCIPKGHVNNFEKRDKKSKN